MCGSRRKFLEAGDALRLISGWSKKQMSGVCGEESGRNVQLQPEKKKKNHVEKLESSYLAREEEKK